MSDLDGLLIQTRSNDGNLRYFETLRKAVEYAKTEPDVYKISITLPTKEHLRLVRSTSEGEDTWTWEPIAKDIY